MKKGKDEFGDRMKLYETAETKRKFLPALPIIVRLDGKNFHNWTKGLNRPYDKRLSNLMIETTITLVEKTNALLGYTQSDEISLVFFSPDIRSQIYFDGRVQKMISVLASMATAYFNERARLKLFSHTVTKGLALFDCRAWQLPNKTEATNAILWRELDAIKNSVSIATRYYYSHQQLQGLRQAGMIDLLHRKGIDWADYPDFFKRGTYVQRTKKLIKYTPSEIEKLPEQHAARIDPNSKVERSVVEVVTMPPLATIVNRENVIFEGHPPFIKQLRK